jgi:hypothetical protein
MWVMTGNRGSKRLSVKCDCEFPNYLAPFFPRYLAVSVRAIRLARTHCGPSNSREVDEAALSRQGKPASPRRTLPDSALLGSAVPGDAFLGFFLDSSGFSLFGRRFVNPHLGLDWIPGASPRRD